jgi:meiotically up-regulated gene 157 (Mug157) protein
MWLRDSTNQFIPYIRMPNNCTHIPALTRGILNTQAEFLMVDAYTNAFKRFEGSTTKRPSYLNDISETLVMGIPVDLCRKREFATQQIWERKWEVDSPSAFLRLAHEYYQRFNNTDFFNVRFFKALARILTVFDEQVNDSAF